MHWKDIRRDSDAGLRLGILGNPIEHSLSPIMHNAALRALGIHGSYEAFAVEESEFQSCVYHLRDCGFMGLNVTIPHKELAAKISYADHDVVKILGVANTLMLTYPIRARNTDVEGFYAPLKNMQPGRALVLGAGGAAKAVVYALLSHGWQVSLYNRTREKAKNFVRFFNADIEILENPDPRNCNLVVNATPLGLHDEMPEILWENIGGDTCVYDLAYRKEPTELLKFAASKGLRIIDGREMLVEQGALSLEWWIGVRAQRDVMRKAVGLEV
ncbi:MAG TPA: shikimate dehydrogenase [Fimbriimonadales bacterium]|nr:shikimate dehydrogenase [Fimbriimonadales bacterium]